MLGGFSLVVDTRLSRLFAVVVVVIGGMEGRLFPRCWLEVDFFNGCFGWEDDLLALLLEESDVDDVELCWSLDLFAFVEGVGDIDTFELDLSSTRGREADDNDKGELGVVGVIVDGEGEGVTPLL